MNNVRRLWTGGGATTTTALEHPDQDYESSSGTGWTAQGGSDSASNPLAGSSRPTRTPSPTTLPRLRTNQSLNGNSRVPSRQNSTPLSPDDADASAKRANSVSSQSSRTGGAKKHRPGHSKALSSFSKRMVNGSASPSSNQGPVLNPKDELIIELLASEAVVDSRDYEIMGTDQLDELKKVCADLQLPVSLSGQTGAQADGPCHSP